MWLLRTPHAYTRLTTEIRTTFPHSAADMKFTQLADLPYMNACIDEALRIFPPLPTGLARTVPAGGDTVDGEPLPGGVTVSVYGWSATHSPRNFHLPEEFIPERWIAGEASSEFARDQKDASQPFSLGPRGCIGKHLSYLELRLILAHLLWHFDIERSDVDLQAVREGRDGGFDVWDPSGDCRHIKAFNTWNKPPLMCRLTHVKR